MSTTETGTEQAAERVKIGLEIHVQLNTKTKLFCACATKAGEPNARTCPVCLGHPGSKPVLNKAALDAALRIALALDFRIAERMRFARKTYFYPDLAKNFQITQYDEPLGKQGSLLLSSGARVELTRVHVEEDPASLQHAGAVTLVDYNRSGIPLVEIVTEPVLESPEQAREFMNALLNILLYLDVFDPEQGIIKADANVSVAKTGFTRVEIKNVSGFKEIHRALDYEIRRQQSHEVVRETRGWNADEGLTYSMRSKETEEDYGYINEPDLPDILIDNAWVELTRNSIPELPKQKAERWVKALGLDPTDSAVIASDKALSESFERIIKTVNPILASKWYRRDVLKVLKDSGKSIGDINEKHLQELLELVQAGTITDKVAKELLVKMVEKDFSPKEAVAKQGLAAVGDEAQIRAWCQEAIRENPDAVKDYAAGEVKSFNFLVGQVMKKSKGKAKPDIVGSILKKLIG
ncbi:Asp-tRNA(Asn)/Glu-tRNA(Gln) amidotransferase subunit GatB [Candidatus Woesearchaeota archaeon]|nr:Asp-tRNA(Asn)/Glu-tRNA(Gln) amidotransferase subunit GatB [Candidatus Woesearchaeota archaeon]